MSRLIYWVLCVMNRNVVALGNPGKQYEATKHNVAWLILDYLGISQELSWVNKFKGSYSSNLSDGIKTHFLKPATFMNLSGESVVAMINFFKIDLGDLLVVHDDIDLPFGTIGFKRGGGLSGHNGLKSIAEKTGSKDFCRLRVGIGRPARGSVSNWVLTEFEDNEKQDLDLVLGNTARALETYLQHGFEKAANEFSKKNFLE